MDSEENQSRAAKPLDTVKAAELPPVQNEAFHSFTLGQGADASSQRRLDTEQEVAKGNIPQFGIDFGPNASTTEQLNGDTNSATTGDNTLIVGLRADVFSPAPRDARDKNSDRPGKGDGGKAHDNHNQDHMVIDRKASSKFVAEARRATQNVRDGLPEGVRDVLKDVEVTPVKSLKDRKSGDTVNGAYGNDELMIAEKRIGKAKLESVIKHEFGHAFDEQKENGKELSEDPEFRKLVDAGTSKDRLLQRIKKDDPQSYYAEVFADLFASNLKAPSNDLAIPFLDKRLPGATDWVKRQMQK